MVWTDTIRSRLFGASPSSPEMRSNTSPTEATAAPRKEETPKRSLSRSLQSRNCGSPSYGTFAS
eukprot:m.43161 g.43161  ORF g.43161 m.43161 type:complete len:64 (+) comp10741_c0_seq2:119-310(+)